MERVEGSELEGSERARAGRAAKGSVTGAAARRGWGRGAALLAAALVAVNWAGWVRYGPAAAARDGDVRPLAIASLLPQDVAAAERLTVVLDRPLAGYPAVDPNGDPNGTAPEHELAAAPFRSPDGPSGRWVWASPSSLALVLDRPLAPGRVIELRPTPALEQLAGRPIAPDTVARFETGPLELRAVSLRSADPSDVTLELEFNAPVEATALAAALVLEEPRSSERARGGRAAELWSSPARVLTVGASERHTARFPRPGAESGTDFILRLPSGFLPAVGTLGLAAEAHHAVSIPRELDALHAVVKRGDDPASASIRVRFDRALDGSQEAPPVSVTPTVAPLSARLSGQDLTLEGPFLPRTRYVVEVGPSLLAADGRTLGRTRRLTVDVPALPARLELQHDDGILTPGGGLGLTLDATNVPSVEVTAHEVLPGNLVAHLRGERVAYTSRNVASRVVPLLLDPDVPGRRVLDLAGVLGGSSDGARGVYAIEVRSTENPWLRARARVRVTDLAPTVKADADGYHVWVRSITTGAAVPNAVVSALTVTDQLVGSARTDAAGYAAMEVPLDHVHGRAFVIVVERDGDLAYVRTSGPSWNVPRELAEGRSAPRRADVFLYPARRLHRPGDTVRLTGVARTPAGTVLARELRIVVERPDGITALDARVTPDVAQGVFHLDVPTELDARTGTWQVSAYLADASLGGQADAAPVGRTRFGVEAFLPARLVLTTERPTLAAGAPGEAREDAARDVAGDVDASGPRIGARVRSLAGTSVAGFGVAVAARWTPMVYRSERHAGFRFDLTDDPRAEVLTEWRGALDEEGAVALAAPGAAELPPGRWRARIDWSVTEPGGRSVAATESLSHDAPALHVGLALGAADGAGDARIAQRGDGEPPVVLAGGPLTVRWVAVDEHDEPAEAPALGYELARVELEGRIEDVGGHLAWVRRERLEVVDTGVAAAAGAGSAGAFEVAVGGPARYRLALRLDGGATVTRDFFAASGDLTRFSPPVEDLEAVTLAPLVPAARPGETVEVDVRAPFDGSLLVTLEDSRLRSQQRVELVGGTARIAVALPSDLRGDAFLSAQVTRPLERSAAWRPHRAYGWTRVRTLHDDRALDVAITVPEVVRPGGRASVTVALTGALTGAYAADPARPAAVHLYAVDEGIRVAGGDRRPDPAAHFFAPRAHATRTADVWSELLPDFELPPDARRIGGDGDLDAGEARRRAPERVRRAPGVVWQRFVALGADGARTFELDLPDGIGTLTWLAVVVDGDRYGSTQAATLLRGDLPLEASFPRFVAPGDRFLVPVSFENPTDVPAEVGLELALAGPLELLRELDEAGRDLPSALAASAPVERRGAGPGSAGADRSAERAPRVTIAPGARVRRWLELRATAPTQPLGEASHPVGQTAEARITGAVRLAGTFADGRAVAESVAVDVPVRTGRPLVELGLVRGMPAGSEVTLDLARELGLDRAEGLATAEVGLSSSADPSLEVAAEYVLGYPHGCAEQTASRVLALLAMPRTAPDVEGAREGAPEGERDATAGREGAHAQALDARIAAGIDRLWSLQVSGGGIAYWSGDSTASRWATLYVAEVLHACREAGHDVPEAFGRRVAGCLEDWLPEAGLHELGGASARVGVVRALTALGRPQPGWTQRLAEQVGELDRNGVLELAYAAALEGRRDAARAWLAAAAEAPLVREWKVGSESGGHLETAAARLRSPVRTLALELRTRLALDPADGELPRVAGALLALRGAGATARYASTLDNAVALYALARYRAACVDAPADWQGTLTTRAGVRAVRSDDALRCEVDVTAPVVLRTSGIGTAWLSARAIGRRAADAPARDDGLVVRRRWLDAAEREVDPASVPLGTLVTVELTLATDGRAAVADVAVLDALPGGFEVEHPRLANTVVADETAVAPLRALRPDRVEFLDDRVLVFATARPEAAVVRYQVRAVALGAFEHAPVQAEAMYDPSLASIGGPTTTVEVAP